MRTQAILLLTVALLTTGCIGALDEDIGAQSQGPAAASDLDPTTPVRDRHELNWTTDAEYSKVLEEGPFEILDGVSVHVTVDLPATEGSAAATDRARVHMGIFLPEIEGCDWGLEDVQELMVTPEAEVGNEDLAPECQVPVVADVGPYYSHPDSQVPQLEGDNPATEPADRLGGFLIENLVPHGYAVAQVSIFGTGQSSHCMDLMGHSEQAGIDAAVEFLGEASFSNGNVGLTGRSYDGTTPWEAAATPEANDHLKTIAPISGLIGLKDLMWRNGSSESRGGSGLLYGLYYGFAPDGDQQDLDHIACPDALQGGPQHNLAYATGGDMGPSDQAYWAERSGFLEKALENYNGSVFLIHGLQDWNVDPHMAFPTHQKLEEAGIEVKGLYGQWAHDYPDRQEEHEGCDGMPDRCHPPESVRYDWAQEMLEWFDHYLKGTGEKPELHAQVQDDQGHWRIEETYPPADRQPVEVTFDEAEEVVHRGTVFATTRVANVDAQSSLALTFPPLSNTTDTLLAGTHHLHVTVTPTGPGGQLFAELRDAETDKRLGHAIMDLRYHAGGDEMQAVTPGQPIVAKMEFQAFDAVLPAGHGIELVLQDTGEDYLPSPVASPVLVDLGEESVLRLFEVERTVEDYFIAPGPHGELPDYDLAGFNATAE